MLMDEPLGALDKQLREHMQLEIKQLHERLGVTVVYVTHDQSEALTMSDRIAVFNDGAIQQLDTPAELYERPANCFVAHFIGENNRLARHGARDRGRARAGSRLGGGEQVMALPRSMSAASGPRPRLSHPARAHASLGGDRGEAAEPAARRACRSRSISATTCGCA